MGLKNPQDYVITEHAYLRFIERFKLDKEEADDFFRRHIPNSIMIKKERDNRELWANIHQNFCAILDTTEKKVITVYQIKAFDEKLIQNDLAQEMMKTINSFKYKVIRETAEFTAPIYKELSVLETKLTTTYQPKLIERTLKLIEVLNDGLAYHIKKKNEALESCEIEINRIMRLIK